MDYCARINEIKSKRLRINQDLVKTCKVKKIQYTCPNKGLNHRIIDQLNERVSF